jgi:GntR family transcriptional regulator, transcriptional repressor for pyruvate dehydrogenase complex
VVDAPLHRETLATQLAQRMIAFITVNGLKSGAALPSEARLASQFGVSRPIMRESLRVLQTRGIIEVTNGKGATVRPLTSDPLSSFFAWATRFDEQALVELLEVRKGLEQQSAALAAARRTPEDIAALRAMVATMAQHIHDADTYIELDYTLHLQIAIAAHNGMLRHLIASIREPLKEMSREGLRRQPADRGRRGIQARHEQLVEAIAAGDGVTAAAAMADHLDGARTMIVLDQYEREEDVASDIAG